ncbi:ABC transporter ATP-binding protein uup [compost metagenome]
MAAARRKLSYKEQRELDALPAQIEALESEQAALQEETANPDFYLRPQEQTHAALARLEHLQHELDRLLERWAELEG